MTTPDQYTPRQSTIVDVIAYSRRLLESVVRNNPLTNATVGEGLIKWLGNYLTSGTSDPINFLWIGEFLPADPNLGGVGQRGFSLVRDDSRGGRSAISMFDHEPNTPGGLKQILTFASGDGFLLSREHRNGGEEWPGIPIPLYWYDNDISSWPSTASSTWSGVLIGQTPVLGRHISYRLVGVTTNGAAGDLRLRVEGGSFQASSPVYSLAADAQGTFSGVIDVSGARGGTLQVYVEAQRTNGVGKVHATMGHLICRSEG